MRNIIIVIFINLLLVACTSKPILNINNSNVPTAINGERLSIEQVQRAIFSACARKGWSPRLIKPGLIEASISVRSHQATVDIPFDTNSFSIHYKSSNNLNADNDSIHRNYNNWVLKLSRTIQKELGVNSQTY